MKVTFKKGLEFGIDEKYNRLFVKVKTDTNLHFFSHVADIGKEVFEIEIDESANFSENEMMWLKINTFESICSEMKCSAELVGKENDDNNFNFYIHNPHVETFKVDMKMDNGKFETFEFVFDNTKEG